MFQTRYSFPELLLSCALLLSVTGATACAQTASPSGAKLALRAALLVTPEFCDTKFKKGSWATIKETFEVGKIACAELEPALAQVFSSLTPVTAIPSSGDTQVVLFPRFVDVGATTTMSAFSNAKWMSSWSGP